MRRWAQKVAVVLATGYILFFYSERMFWSFLRPGDKLADLLLTWIVYSLLAWVFLLLARHCRVATFPALFLAGAVFGWMAEGVVVDTMYGNKDNPFPGSISFTGLAWHALISVGVGWYWQARVLTAGEVTNRPQVVYVPVRMGGDPTVVSNPRRQTSGSESTADIDVEAAPQADRTEPADGHHSLSAAHQHQCIGSGLGGDSGRLDSRPCYRLIFDSDHSGWTFGSVLGGGKENRLRSWPGHLPKARLRDDSALA